MKIETRSAFIGTAAQGVSAESILGFVATHRFRLWHAARILGGYESARLVDRCADLLEADRKVTSRTRMMLAQILALLSLEHVGDPDLPYMGFFAVVDPADRVVEDICLLCDGLADALAQFDRGPGPRFAAP